MLELFSFSPVSKTLEFLRFGVFLFEERLAFVGAVGEVVNTTKLIDNLDIQVESCHEFCRSDFKPIFNFNYY